jgi:phage shock protein A
VNAQTVLAILGAVLGIIGTLGIAYAVFRSATVQKTLDLYRSENEALGKAVARLTADHMALAAKAEQLETANRVLQETVSGRDAIERLTTRLVEFQADRATEHKTMMELLDDIRESLGEIWRGTARLLGERNV